MDKRITVLTPHGRRHVVKVTQNTTLLQILEETCQKYDFDSETYSLRHHNKEVSLNQMFRFSGLPNNCLLEMSETQRKRAVVDVEICLQLEDGTRHQGIFVPIDSIWHVIETLCSQAAADYDYPVAIFMRRELMGKDQLSNTSLKALGITEGRAMIRIFNKKPDELKTQASVYIAPKQAEKEHDLHEEKVVRNPPKAGGGGGFAITKDIFRSLQKNSDSTKKTNEINNSMNPRTAENNNIDARPSHIQYDWGTGLGHTIRGDTENKSLQTSKVSPDEDEEEGNELNIDVIGERNAVLFSLDAAQKNAEILPDSFFDLTVTDLKLVLRDLHKIVAGNEDAPLLTEKLRELEENKTMLNKIAMYKNCVIRIQFPDRYVLQGLFKPIDKVTNVLEFVKKFLFDEQSKFYLFTIPPKVILPYDKTLLELDFVPTAVVHFAYDENSTAPKRKKYIKTEYLNRLTSAEGAFKAATKLRISKSKSSTEPGVEKPMIEPEPALDSCDSANTHKNTDNIPKRARNDNFENQF